MTSQDTQHQIRSATRADTTPASGLIAAAFHELDVSAWLVPDPRERTHVLTDDFHIFVEHALIHGDVQLLENGASKLLAAAVWFPQVSGLTPPPDDYDTRLAAACGAATSRFQLLDEYFADTHPQAFPHHYLAYLATRPGHQSRGLGTALLRRHHQHLDHHDIPAFLHASCARTRDFYQRHGYEPLDEPFRLPDTTPMWPMWREPNPPR